MSRMYEYGVTGILDYWIIRMEPMIVDLLPNPNAIVGSSDRLSVRSAPSSSRNLSGLNFVASGKTESLRNIDLGIKIE